MAYLPSQDSRRKPVPLYSCCHWNYSPHPVPKIQHIFETMGKIIPFSEKLKIEFMDPLIIEKVIVRSSFLGSIQMQG